MPEKAITSCDGKTKKYFNEMETRIDNYLKSEGIRREYLEDYKTEALTKVKRVQSMNFNMHGSPLLR